jgi:hypothetical protein
MAVRNRVSVVKWLSSGELSIKNAGKSEHHPFHEMDNGDKMTAGRSLKKEKFVTKKVVRKIISKPSQYCLRWQCSEPPKPRYGR